MDILREYLEYLEYLVGLSIDLDFHCITHVHYMYPIFDLGLHEEKVCVCVCECVCVHNT